MKSADKSPKNLHLFFDAEGTLYETKNNYEYIDFWNGEHSLERAKKIFRLNDEIKIVLDKMKKKGIPMYVVSKHEEELLPELLLYFGINLRQHI